MAAMLACVDHISIAVPDLRRGIATFTALGIGDRSNAARWMTDHGLPPPARGTRNTGEPAMLVSPDEACGTYIAFVGAE
jgi:hypothetical protein